MDECVCQREREIDRQTDRERERELQFAVNHCKSSIQKIHRTKALTFAVKTN